MKLFIGGACALAFVWWSLSHIGQGAPPCGRYRYGQEGYSDCRIKVIHAHQDAAYRRGE